MQWAGRATTRVAPTFRAEQAKHVGATLVVALPTCKNLKRTRHFVSHYLFYSPLQEPDKNVILTFTASGQHMPQFGHASPHISIQIDTRNLCNQMCIVYKNLPPKSKKWAWSR